MARFRVTTRISGTVEHERFDSLDSALAALERRGHVLQGEADAEVVGGSLMRRYEPEDQVTARLELGGPRGLRVGVDVRGDGSAIPFTGRWVRRPVERADSESAYDALRRITAD